MRSKSTTSLSPILFFANESWYLSCAYHLATIVGWLSRFPCIAFVSISFALKNITCLSDAPCFGPRLDFFLMTKPGIEVKSNMATWIVVGLRLYFKFSRNCNKWSRFVKRHCNQEIKVCQNSRRVLWFMSSSNFCNFSLNLLISCFLTHVFKELFLMLMFLEHLDQLCDVSVAVHPAVSPVEIDKPSIR